MMSLGVVYSPYTSPSDATELAECKQMCQHWFKNILLPNRRMQDATIYTGCEPTCIAIGKCINNYKLVSYENSNNYAFTARQNETASECNANRLLFQKNRFCMRNKSYSKR